MAFCYHNHRTSLFLLALLHLSVFTPTEAYGNFRWYCDLQFEPVVELEWNPVTRSYEVVMERRALSSSSSTNQVDNDNLHVPTAKRRRQDDHPSRRLTSSFSSDIEAASLQNDLSSSLRGGDPFEYQNQQRALLSSLSVPISLQPNDTATMTYQNLSAFGLASYRDNETYFDHQNWHVEHQNANRKRVKARRCYCWRNAPLGTQQDKDYYCPIPRTHCGLGTGWAAAVENNNGGSSSKSSGSVVRSTAFYFSDPGCVDVSRRQSFARNVWPIITVWYVAIILCLLMTRPGRHAMGWCLSKIWPRWNEYATQRIMREHPDLTNRIVIRRQMQESLRNHHHNNISRVGAVAGFEVTFEVNNSGNNNNNGGEEVVLRTKTFHYGDSTKKQSSDNKQKATEAEPTTVDTATGNSQPEQLSTKDTTITTTPTTPSGAIPLEADKEPNTTAVISTNGETTCDEDDDDDAIMISCAICHAPVEDGDRVGDLPCNHVMHIECLKAWIVRRNVCPLCLTENIATPRRNPEEEGSNNNNLQQHLPELVVTGE